LVVVVHGDLSDGGRAEYHQSFAQEIARRNPGVVAAALIRPGYSGGNGLQSPGTQSRRDHYTRRNNDLVAQTIGNLQRQTGARRTIVVGHSGGAAQTAAIIGRHPGLIDAAILVGCPCDIGRWRSARGRGAWPNSENPMRYVSGVRRSTQVVTLVGSNDDNTFPALSEDYVAALTARGVPATHIEVRGGRHGFNSMSRHVRSVVEQILAR
jgi:pimeloyl-ACP methyl ester carboxylesterase